jgi:hypothetical protein
VFTELQSEQNDYNIEILGVNWNRSDVSSNELMTTENDLPWLQDTFEANLQRAFGATYRDVVILDALNRPIDPPFNLTANDLANEATREALKARLRQAAVIIDTDGDKIGDDWEERYRSGLGEGAEENLLEYALGAPPNGNGRTNTPSTGTKFVDGEAVQFVTFRRRLGSAGGLNCVLQWSENGEIWGDARERFEMTGVENLYDGTGTELVKFEAKTPAERKGLLRVKVGF